MDTFKQPWVTYLGVAIAFFAIVAGALDLVDPQIVWGVAGIFGFGSIASLRAYIESEGWKTYLATGIPIVLGILELAGLIDYQLYQVLMAAFAPLTAATIQHGLKKAA